MFSKKTQQFVQKVRPKSIHLSKNIELNGQQQSSSDELTHSNTIECDSIENSLNSSSNNNNSSNQSSFTNYKKNFLSSQVSKQQNSIDEQKLNGLL
jgi:hypothetical protein